MNVLFKIAAYDNHIGGVSIEKVKRIAATRSMSQEQFAEFIGVSVSNLRQKLKDNKIKWRNQHGRLVRRKNIDKTMIDEKRNGSYFNPALNSRVKHQFTSGYYNLR